MSYKERSIWASLAILIYIWFEYFSGMNQLYGSQKLTVDSINELLLDAVIMTIVLEILLQIVIAIIDHKDANYDEDERDKLITLHGCNNAYYFLLVGAHLAVFYSVFPTLKTYILPSIDLPNGYFVMHLIIIFALLSEIIRLATQIRYYRRGF
ncbi:MAG: hypothetical protein HRT52_13350 [Colwellia sp.]|nr:hypothetical protein [Colwellia sp.]